MPSSMEKANQKSRRKRRPGDKHLVLLGSELNAVDSQNMFRLKALGGSGKETSDVRKIINGSPLSWAEFSDASFSVKESLALIPRSRIVSDSIPAAISTATTETETSGEHNIEKTLDKERFIKSNSMKSLFSRSKDATAKKPSPPRRVSRLWKKVTSTGKLSKKGNTMQPEMQQLENVDAEPSSTSSARQKAMLRAESHQRKVRGRLGIDERIDVFEPVLKMNFPDAESLKHRRRIRTSEYRRHSNASPNGQPEQRPMKIDKEVATETLYRQPTKLRPPSSILYRQCSTNTTDEHNDSGQQELIFERRPSALRSNHDALQTRGQCKGTTSTETRLTRETQMPFDRRADETEHTRAKLSCDDYRRLAKQNTDFELMQAGQKQVVVSMLRDVPGQKPMLPSDKEIYSLTEQQKPIVSKTRGGIGIEPRIDVFSSSPIESQLYGEENLGRQHGRIRLQSRKTKAKEPRNIAHDPQGVCQPKSPTYSYVDSKRRDCNCSPPLSVSSDSEILNEILKNDSDPMSFVTNVLRAKPFEPNTTIDTGTDSGYQDIKASFYLDRSPTSTQQTQENEFADGIRPQRATSTNIRDASLETNDAEEIDRLLAMLYPLTNEKEMRTPEMLQSKEMLASGGASLSVSSDSSHMAMPILPSSVTLCPSLSKDPSERSTAPSKADYPPSFSRDPSEHQPKNFINFGSESLSQRPYASGPIRKYWSAYSNFRSRGSFDSSHHSDEFKTVESSQSVAVLCAEKITPDHCRRNTEWGNVEIPYHRNDFEFGPVATTTNTVTMNTAPNREGLSLKSDGSECLRSNQPLFSRIIPEQHVDERSTILTNGLHPTTCKDWKVKRNDLPEREVSPHDASARNGREKLAPRSEPHQIKYNRPLDVNETFTNDEEIGPDVQDCAWTMDMHGVHFLARNPSKAPAKRDPPNAKPFGKDADGRDPPEMKTTKTRFANEMLLRQENEKFIRQELDSEDSNDQRVFDSDDFIEGFSEPNSNESTCAVKEHIHAAYSDETESSSDAASHLSNESLSDSGDFKKNGSFESFRKSIRQRQVAMRGLDTTIYTISERDSKSTVSSLENAVAAVSQDVPGRNLPYAYGNQKSASNSEYQPQNLMSKRQTSGGGLGSFTEPIDAELVASRYGSKRSRDKCCSDSITNMDSPISEAHLFYEVRQRSLTCQDKPTVTGQKDEIGNYEQDNNHGYALDTVYSNSPYALSVNSDSTYTDRAVSGSPLPILPPRSFDAQDEEEYPTLRKRGSFDSISFVTEPRSSNSRTEYLESDSNSTTGGIAPPDLYKIRSGESQMFRFERMDMENSDPPVYRKTLPPALRNTLILSMSPMVETGSMDESEESSYDDSTLGDTKDNGCTRADACGILAPVFDALSGLQDKFGAYCS